jgi:hypothetical protein
LTLTAESIHSKSNVSVIAREFASVDRGEKQWRMGHEARASDGLVTEESKAEKPNDCEGGEEVSE